jgi:hypothetical protein
MDAAPEGLTSPDAFAPDTCGFDVGIGSGSTKASVVGGTATASPGGTEIPFILWSCSGTAGGVPYTVTGQYNVQVGIGSLGLTTGTSTFSFMTPGGCTGTALFDGQAYPAAGDPYRLGEKFELAFQCSMLTNQAGATASIASGALSAILTP